MVGTCVDLTGDLEVAVVELLQQLDLFDRRRHERLGLVDLGEILKVLRQRAGVRADPHRDPGLLRGVDHQLDLVRPTDVAGIDPDGGHTGLDRLQRQAGVEVNVRNDRNRAEADDASERVGVLCLRHGTANDLATGRHERRDLGRGRLDVTRWGERHGLHDDRRTAADRDVAERESGRRKPSRRSVAALRCQTRL